MSPSFYFYVQQLTNNVFHTRLQNLGQELLRVDVNILNADLNYIFMKYSLPYFDCIALSINNESYYVSQGTMLKIQELYQNKSISIFSIVHVIDNLIFEIIEAQLAEYRLHKLYGDNFDNLDDIFKNLQYIGDIESLVTVDFCEAFDIGYVIEYENKSYVFMTL